MSEASLYSRNMLKGIAELKKGNWLPGFNLFEYRVYNPVKIALGGVEKGLRQGLFGIETSKEAEDRISKEIRAGGADILKTEGLDGYLNYLSHNNQTNTLQRTMIPTLSLRSHQVASTQRTISSSPT